MRTFTCFVTEAASPTPTLSFILAESDDRALELARRQLKAAIEPSYIELWEGSKLVWAESTLPLAPLPPRVRPKQPFRSWAMPRRQRPNSRVTN